MNDKEKLSQLVYQIKTWLRECGIEEDSDESSIDAVSYSEWREIETFFTDLLSRDAIKDLDNDDKINLLYLISKNWDIASLIAWLSNQPNLSNCGDLKKEDFITLAYTLIDLDKEIFNDAKSQFARSFSKWEVLEPDVEKILLAFYNSDDEYTQRVALLSLGKLHYWDIQTLLKRSWQVEEEHYKITCLSLIDEYIKDDILMVQYLKQAEQTKGEYLASYVQQLQQKYEIG